MSKLSTHRVIQLSQINDRASTERVRYYVNSIKASALGNRSASVHFAKKAQQWERIRIASQRILINGKLIAA